jgi:hypothetical protein
MKLRRHSRSIRGQAITELAIVSMLAVTVIVIGIYFAESSYAAVKVHEAAAFATWDQTGSKAGGNAGRANARYSDFDSNPGGGASATLALMNASNLQANCAGSNLGGLVPNPFGALANSAGRSCSASGSIKPARWMPTATLFGEESTRNAYTVCAMGRNSGGCGGRLSLLTDDWALSELGQEADVPGNAAYEGTTQTIWAANGGAQGAASQNFASKYAGVVPYNLPFEMRVNDDHTRAIPTAGAGSFLP